MPADVCRCPPTSPRRRSRLRALAAARIADRREPRSAGLHRRTTEHHASDAPTRPPMTPSACRLADIITVSANEHLSIAASPTTRDGLASCTAPLDRASASVSSPLIRTCAQSLMYCPSSSHNALVNEQVLFHLDSPLLDVNLRT